MTTPLEVRNAIVTTLRAAYAPTSVPTVAPHDGEFGRDGLATKTARAPAIFVACLDLVGTTDELGAPAAVYRWAAFVVAKLPDRLANQDSRGDVAMVLAADVARRIHGETWGELAAAQPDRIRAQNLYSKESADRGVATWVVTWEQTVTFDPLVDAATLSNLLLVHSEFSLQPGTPDTAPSVVEVPLEAAP